MQVRRKGILLGIAVGLTAACGADRGREAFDVSPAAPSLQVGERISLTARPLEEGAGEVEWEVLEQAGGGLLHSRGPTVTYVAPVSAGTYHLRLRAPRPGAAALRQELEIQVRPVLRMEPATATVAPGGTVQFTVRQRGLPRGTMAWSLEDPDGGSLSADGLYRAPASRGTYRVLATSTEDREWGVSATVTVQ